MKNIYTKTLLVAIMLLCCTAASAYDFELNGIYYYKYSDNTVSIARVKNRGYSGSITIPDEITYEGTTYKVTDIYQLAFNDCTELTEVIIGRNVRSIGEKAFAYCTGLESITIPPSLKYIEYEAFDNCSSLKEVRISDLAAWCDINFWDYYDETCISNPLYYAGNLYLNGNLLTNLTIPGNVTKIKKKVFEGCTSIRSITIHKNVTTIEKDAFSYCHNIEKTHINDLSAWCKIDIESGVPGELYLNGNLLTSLVIPDDVTEIKPYTFGGENITSIKFHDNVTSIGDHAFSYCKSLTTIDIPDNVTRIGHQAFYYCENLETIAIGSGVESIGDQAFCTWGRNVNKIYSRAKTPPVCETEYNIFYDYSVPLYVPFDSKEAYQVADDWKRFTNIVEGYPCGDNAGYDIIDSTLIVRGSGAMYNYSYYDYPWYNQKHKFNKVIIEEGITSVGNMAFYQYENITSITLPESLTTIYYQAFQDCTGLTSITIPNNVTEIKSFAFRGCTGLTSIAIPSSVTTIGNETFKDCTGLKELHISDLSAWCNISFSSLESSPTHITKNIYLNGEKITELVIPDGVTEVKNFAFYNCSDLTSIVIPSSVTQINGYYTFKECPNIKYVNLEDGEKIISLSQNLFSDLPLDSAYIGRSYTYTEGTNTAKSPFCFIKTLKKVTIGDYATSFGKHAFCGCEALTSIRIPEGTTTIGDYAFYECYALENIELPKGVTKIGYYSFWNCKTLESITLPESITYIDDGAFELCSNVKEIYVKAETPATINNNYSFYEVYEATLYVPKGTKAIYQSANIWKNFNNIVEKDFKIVGDLNNDGIVNVADITAIVDIILNSEETDNKPTETTFDSWTSTNAGLDSSISENSYLLNASIGSVLTFDWSVSSESGWDKLIITLDGNEILNKSGEESGNYTHTFTTKGIHTLLVKYTKDGSANRGDDQGKIYNIKLSGSAENKNTAGDINGDEVVNVADVTGLVNIILNGSK